MYLCSRYNSGCLVLSSFFLDLHMSPIFNVTLEGSTCSRNNMMVIIYIILNVANHAGNIINFNVGSLVDLDVPRSFWNRLAGKYGNMFYWKEKVFFTYIQVYRSAFYFIIYYLAFRLVGKYAMASSFSFLF